MLARLNANGSYDANFGSIGIVITAPPVAFTNLEITSLLLQPDGKIVAAGTIWIDYSETFFAARYLLNGLPDTSFGTNGMWIADASATYGKAYDVAIDVQGRLILGGVSGGKPLVARLTALGALDTSFGENGFTSVDYAAGYVGSIAVDKSGRILFASQSSYEEVGAVAMRFSSDGQLDTTFGDGGRAVSHFDAYLDINDIAIDANGKMLTAGYIQQGEDPNNTQFLVMRYLNPTSSAGAVNILINGDFEDSLTGWIRSEGKGAKRLCTAAFSGSCSFRLSNGFVSQKIAGSAVSAGDVLWLDLWASGQNVAAKASVKMVVTYTDGHKERVSRFFPSGTYAYTNFQSDVLILSAPVKKIKVEISNTGGKLFVDNIQLLHQGATALTTESWLPLPPNP